MELEKECLLLKKMSDMFTTGLFIINSLLKGNALNYKKFHKLKVINSQIKSNLNNYSIVINLIQNNNSNIYTYFKIIDKIITTIELNISLDIFTLENMEIKLIKIIKIISKIYSKLILYI